MRTYFVCLVLVALVGGAASHADSASPQFTVSSSLNGKTVLPLRSRWLAYPKVPATKIKEVDFLIDGKLSWIENRAPYNYGSDDFHGHLGYLITTWLTPGRHTFTARAIDKQGRTATDTVVARVLPAPDPSADLAGAWARSVSNEDLRKSGPEPPPSGVWKLVFDRVGAWHLDPLGGGVVNQADVAGDVIHVYAPITMAPRRPNGEPATISRFGNRVAVGGGLDCREDGPFGSYNWSVTGNHLTLTAIKEGCGNRRAIWEGTWTRVGHALPHPRRSHGRAIDAPRLRSDGRRMG